jgi:hypothetical protein
MAERREGEPRRRLVVRRSRGAGLASRGGGDGNGAFSNGFGSKNEKREFGALDKWRTDVADVTFDPVTIFK